jgi:hypothetical protein
MLGKKQYFPLGAPPKSENRLFRQYHAEYPQHEKERLINGLINNMCKARVLFVTVAFGIGVDLPSIRQVFILVCHELWKSTSKKSCRSRWSTSCCDNLL